MTLMLDRYCELQQWGLHIYNTYAAKDSVCNTNYNGTGRHNERAVE